MLESILTMFLDWVNFCDTWFFEHLWDWAWRPRGLFRCPEISGWPKQHHVLGSLNWTIVQFLWVSKLSSYTSWRLPENHLINWIENTVYRYFNISWRNIKANLKITCCYNNVHTFWIIKFIYNISIHKTSH